MSYLDAAIGWTEVAAQAHLRAAECYQMHRDDLDDAAAREELARAMLRYRERAMLKVEQAVLARVRL